MAANLAGNSTGATPTQTKILMTQPPSFLARAFLCLLAFGLGVAVPTYAQRATTTPRQGVNRGGGNAAGGARSFGGAGGNASRQYNPSGTVGEAIVTSDPETRRLIVITDDETSQYVSQVITNLDRPKPQVLIKVVFLEVTYRNTLDIGVEAGLKKQVNDSATNPAEAIGANLFGLSGLSFAGGSNAPLSNPLGQPLQSFNPTPPGAGLYQILSTDYQVTLKAIAQAGKLQILSRPSILTRNNQQATISLGQEVPLVTNTRFDAVNGQINTVSYTSVGIILRVTPFITADGMVEMIVSPETSQLADRSQWVPISAGALAPVIDSRMADTVVVVPDAQTVIIGGLMQNTKMHSDSKIPLLGDIPFLGNLFKHKTKDDTKTELMIFLTPHIVREPSQLAAVSDREKGKMELGTKAFSEEDLNRFLDTVPVTEPTPSDKKKK
jgi:general secretion pathway protein D